MSTLYKGTNPKAVAVSCHFQAWVSCRLSQEEAQLILLHEFGIRTQTEQCTEQQRTKRDNSPSFREKLATMFFYKNHRLLLCPQARIELRKQLLLVGARRDGLEDTALYKQFLNLSRGKFILVKAVFTLCDPRAAVALFTISCDLWRYTAVKGYSF